MLSVSHSSIRTTLKNPIYRRVWRNVISVFFSIPSSRGCIERRRKSCEPPFFYPHISCQVNQISTSLTTLQKSKVMEAWEWQVCFSPTCLPLSATVKSVSVRFMPLLHVICASRVAARPRSTTMLYLNYHEYVLIWFSYYESCFSS